MVISYYVFIHFQVFFNPLRLFHIVPLLDSRSHSERMFSDKSNCNQNSRPDMLPSTVVEINQFGCKLTKEDTLQDFEFVKTGFVDSSILNFFFIP